ncbi:MAG: methionyl-tRNA formyltransferase [Bacteroidota bacterium]
MVLKINADLRIVFMGTPEFAVAGLQRLVVEGCNIVGVITAPDRLAGRGRKLKASAVKTYAKAQGLRVLQPSNLKDPDFLKELGSLNANLQVVVAFRMLPAAVWSMPEYGTFNLHASLLPQYRGAAPINWAIINGETETGVTTFFIDEKIDTGALLLQEKVTIEPEETAGELHDRLMLLGADLIIQTTKAIAKGIVVPTKQPLTGQLKAAPKIHRETCKINWDLSLEEIYNHIRGLSPYPTAWTTLKNSEEEILLKVYRSKKIRADHQLAIGRVIVDDRKIKIAVKQGYLELHEIQLPGKRKMNVSDVLNGFEVHPDAHVL